jgi:predicted nuclease of predicted toxin-antitoxin system
MTRFLADENVSRLVVERVAAAGFDIVWIGAAHSGASDGAVLEIARREDRILVTEDRDFGEMVVRQRLDAPGVILLELDRLSGEAEAEHVARVIVANEGRLAGNFAVIEPGRIRIRPLTP